MTTMINFEKVNKWVGQAHVLRDIDLQVARGECVAICGPSDSGKSTLIRCVNALESYQGGRLVVDGLEPGGDPTMAEAVRRKVGMVLRRPNLFPHLTVLENLTLAPMWVDRLSRRDADERAMVELERVCLADRAGAYPWQLSGARQQRVAIARALCLEPSILLLDEPTSALEPGMAGEIVEVMNDLASRGVTMICVTEETGFARSVADRVIFMDRGRIVGQARPEEFSGDPRPEHPREFLSRIPAR